MSFTREEIEAEFAMLEGCGLPGNRGENVGFSIWNPEKKARDYREWRTRTGFDARRGDRSGEGRAYREANRESINARRRAAYAKRSA